MKALNFFLIIVLGHFAMSCGPEQTSDSKARAIVEKCVETHGGSHYKVFDVSFDFRKYRVRIKQNGVVFQYERATKDSLNNEIRDILTNERFVRTINGKPQTLSAKDEDRFREATNSIAYFALLPHKLLDAAVRLEHIGTAILAGQQYDKIKVSFGKEGGGKDHDDVFCYWINQKTFTLDYLAYDNGGPRFRKATNRQTVAGVIFQDYENYEIADTLLLVGDYDQVFSAGKAKLLSKIEQTNYIAK